MAKEGSSRNYIWLLHIAIWVVLFGMPFFSPRPGHPLHGGVEYARFLPTLVSFIFVFYVNYFVLIGKYLNKKRFGAFLLWNIVLVAVASAVVHLVHQYSFPTAAGNSLHVISDMGSPGPRPGLGPGPRHIEDSRPPRPLPPPKETLDTLSFITRNTLIYVGIICVAVAVRMTERWYKDESKRQEMEKAATEAELSALKSQVNPHFLFNTLNNIYSLIQIDQDKAQEAVHDLSGMLRYVLYDSERPTVALSSESAFLKDYIKLMSMRLTKDVKLDVNLSATGSERHIAPLLFIPLVENAFKHGISSGKPSSIKIDLHEEGDYVCCLVENTFFPKDETDHSGSGIGVKNLCRRLDMIYPGNYSFEYGKVQNLYRSLLRIDTSKT